MGGVNLREKRRSNSKADDQRHRFERDRDRVLYTRAFRRLAGVTQVARANESYTYHDRLSHSLKVAQIGRRLAEYCNKDNGPDGPDVPDGVSVHPDVVETAALAHDIGHPPFGHAAEKELNRKITEEKGVDQGFEGNAQSFRVVTRLSINDPNKEGLDLTFASLNAILKYPWKRGEDLNQWKVDESKKWGVYESDLDAFYDARKLSSVEKRRSAEADLMDWADDLAYAVHDMEDFYRAGIIPLSQLLHTESEERDRFIKDWTKKTDGVSTDDGEEILEYIKKISGDTLQTSFNGTELERYDLKELSSKLISRYIGVDDGGLRLQDEHSKRHFLQIDEQLENEVSILKHMTFYYVIQDNSLAAQQRGQKKVVGELFDLLYNATLPNNDPESENIRIVPNRYYETAEDLMQNGDRKSRSRFAADVITGMTERQAIQLHKRLMGETPGSLQERILQ